MPQEIPHFIDGARASGRSGRTAPVYNPATGEETGAVALASRDEVEAKRAEVAAILGGTTDAARRAAADGIAALRLTYRPSAGTGGGR